MDMVYLDNSATTKPHKRVTEEVVECMENYFGNPSSAHRLGIQAEKKVKAAREKIAQSVGAVPQEIVFTSGGSEANNTIIKGILKPGDHAITSVIEHPSVIGVLNYMETQGIEVTYLKVDSRGIISLEQLRDSIRDNTRLVTIMHVNNEIGSIQPIEKITEVARSGNKKVKIHIDAVQSFGKIGTDIRKLNIDFMSLSSHKIHGPKGVGALYVKKGTNIAPLISGGGQELNIRSGTENLPGISGFGVASEIISSNLKDKVEHVNSLKEYFISKLSGFDNIIINSPSDDVHIGNILSVSFQDIRGEVMLHALEDYNIYVSTGSACAAKKTQEKNYVLSSIGLKESYAEGTIRFSFSYLNTIEEIDYTVEAIKKALPFLRRIKK